MHVIIGTRPIRRDYAIERTGAKTANVVDIRISALAGGGCSAGPGVSGGVRPVIPHRAAKPSRVPGHRRRRFSWWRRAATTEGSCHVHPHAGGASSPPAGTPHRPSALVYWIGGALMAAAVVSAAIWAAFAFFGDTPPPAGRRRPRHPGLPQDPAVGFRWPRGCLRHPSGISAGRRRRPLDRPPVAPPWLPAGRQIPGSCGDGRVRAVARRRTRMGQDMGRHTSQATGGCEPATDAGRLPSAAREG